MTTTEFAVSTQTEVARRPASGAPRRRAERSRWQRKGSQAMALRVFVIIVPLAASWLVVRFTGEFLGPAAGTGQAVLWWLGTISCGFGAALVVDHLARRLLPLATLFQLTLLFPDRAPSRYRAWRGYRSEDELRRRIEHADTAGEAAVDVLALVAALDRHDRATRGHSERVRLFVELIGEQLRLSTVDRDRLRWGALLHDVGKLDVDHDLLNKKDKPTPEEWDELRMHPHAGLRHIGPLAGWLGEWSLAIAHHHERHDGGGYPEGLRGDEISLAGRITSVADAFEVMTARRPYRRPIGPVAAREELVAHAGKQFDPAIVRAFLEVSLPRLRAALGPTAVLAQLPAIGHVARLPQRPKLFAAVTTAAILVHAGLPPSDANVVGPESPGVVVQADPESPGDGSGLGTVREEPDQDVRSPTDAPTDDDRGRPGGPGISAPSNGGSDTGTPDDPIRGNEAGPDGPAAGQPDSASPDPDEPEPDPSEAPPEEAGPDTVRSGTTVAAAGQGVEVAVGLDDGFTPFIEITPYSAPGSPLEAGTGLAILGVGAEAGVDQNGPYVRPILPFVGSHFGDQRIQRIPL